ncbi:peptidase associated/transthyretin-like domain-containing protein [Chitinophaga ginsengisoli]|uniref:STN and carboxypeptidase regulatory-like domain-containing protein n=1 Tax=Chitinophaga ginsengisoli TaxID=363837 RepID=UPI0011B269A5|nr:STN and carboxypeptidase regulatory-like domain-containing protein [Chitinophaga ginsengisoli]
MKHLMILIAFFYGSYASYAQSPLNKTVTVDADRRPLAVVLDNISMQGGFHFSYVKEFIHDDSLVTIHVSNRSVKQVLDILFQGNFQFREIGDQIIIQPGTSSKEKWFVVSGHVKDAITGSPITNASVYETMQLISTMTNDQGYYRIRLREKERTAAMLTVSKELYRDTIMLIPSGHDQELDASIKPAPPIQLSVVDINKYTHVEQTMFGRFFLSSRQRMQSLNLSDFFTKQPYQYSLVPAIGTHGKIGSQVINKFSMNFIGGYTAGLSGVEIAGVFNIDQKDVKWVQLAGIFNIVGGRMTGVQLAGIHNHTLDSLKGFQAAGISNMVKYGFRGLQASGVYNQTGADSKGAQLSGVISHSGGNLQGLQAAGAIGLARGTVSGAQLAGLANYSQGIGGAQISGALNVNIDTTNGAQISGLINYTKRVKGAQIAGAMNVAIDTVSGAQISGLVNYAGLLKGVQIGVLNYADSSDGYSIGLFSFVRRGYHQVQIYTNEVMDLNVAYKSGNKKLYSLLVAGMTLGDRKAYSFGYGIGHDFRLSPSTFITADVTSQYVYLGNWDATNTMVRLQAVWNRRLAKNITFFAGPTFTVYYSDKLDVSDPEHEIKVPRHYSPFDFGAGVLGWFGWHIGLGFF